MHCFYNILNSSVRTAILYLHVGLDCRKYNENTNLSEPLSGRKTLKKEDGLAAVVIWLSKNVNNQIITSPENLTFHFQNQDIQILEFLVKFM